MGHTSYDILFVTLEKFVQKVVMFYLYRHNQIID